MKKFRRVLIAALFAIILTLGAVCLTACNDKDGGDTKRQYTLRFMVGAVLYDSVTAEEGKTYKDIVDPSRINHVFEGWSQNPDGETEELPDKMPKGDRTYYAIFSARYNLNFNASIGSIPDDKKTVSVKEGDDLYALVADVTPALSDSDATFKGWFLRGTTEITAASGLKMPKGNVEVVAKYSVNYTINVYLENGFGDDGYYDEDPEAISGTAYVGEKVANIPSFPGYYYDEDKENDVLYANLGKNSAQNSFDLYYMRLGYDTIFNANLPSDVEYTGSMETMTCGHGIEYPSPQCDFVADGYRFYGWSTTPDGDVEYRAGEQFSVDKSTTMYAQWVKGMTELAGFSSDRVYLIDEKSGGGLRRVAYLERMGLEDIAGEYNATTHVFTFKNADAADPDAVLLRGIADIAHNTFTYLNPVDTTVYKLQKLDGTEDNTVTLTLNENGAAAYNDGTVTVNGAYEGSGDGSMLFTVDGQKKFDFRLAQSESGFVNFMIRGKEYGTWNNITQAGIVDTSYTLELDGYGHATMTVSGLSNNLSSSVTTEFGGRYVYRSGEGAYSGDKGLEVVVALYNQSLYVKQFACLLITDGSYHSLSSQDTTVYTDVYLERFETTLYGAPEGDAELDQSTADKIELSGYNVVDDSATYTYTDAGGATVAVKGKYSYDRTAGTLRIIRSDGGRDLLFEVSVLGEGDAAVPVFEPVDELFGQYPILGLDSALGPYGIYTLNIYNNNRAAFAFLIPVSDSFYGNIVYEYTRLIYGEYKIATPGTNDQGGSDPRANVYEFSAEISSQVLSYIYNIYGGIFGQPLNVTGFGSFRFQFVYSAQTGNIRYVNVTTAGDFQGGRKLTYNDVEYTLDGFGTAESASGKMQYVYNTSMGIARLFLIPDENKPTETVLYIDWKRDGSFVQYANGYDASNCSLPFFMIVFKDSTALLTLGSSSLDAFSFGQITWDDEEHTSGTYVRNTDFDFSDIYNGVNKSINDFKFIIRTATAKDENGDVQTRTFIYVYDVNASKAASDKIVIVNSDGDELVLDPFNDVTETKNDKNEVVSTTPTASASYIKKGDNGENDTKYDGIYRYVGDKVQLIYTVGESNRVITFRLEYGNGGAITGFHVVGNENGYVLDAADSKSYLYLSGEQTAENGVYGAVYTKYDAETDSYIDFNGTYRATQEENVIGYDFTYKTGETETGDDITETFTFGISSTSSGIPYFQRYVMQLNQRVLYMSASIGQPAQVGTLTGGGFQAQVLTLFQTQYQGNLEWSDEWSVWVFTATDGSVFYFKVLSNIGVFLLDNTYIAETKGMFKLSETIEVEVPATEGQPETEDSPAVPAVPAHTAVVTDIEMSGMAFAYLHYDYQGEDKTITGLYVQYATNGFAFIMVGGEDATALFRFRLMINTDDQTAEVTYVAELANMDYFGTFVGDDLTVINLNGFNSAYYVDGYGRVFSGPFEIVESDETSALIRISYIDATEYTVKYVYARLDFENRTFVTEAAPDTQPQA